MNRSSHKVIGYFAIRKGSPYILCDGDGDCGGGTCIANNFGVDMDLDGLRPLWNLV